MTTAITEAERNQLYNKLGETLGDEEADTLMKLVPPTGWDWEKIATKDDLKHLGSGLRTEMAELRTEVAEYKTATESRIDQATTLVLVELHKELQSIRKEFPIYLFSIMGFVLTVASVIIAAAHLS